MVAQMVDVLDASGGKIIENVDFVPLVEEALGEVAADKTCPTRDEVPHVALLPGPSLAAVGIFGRNRRPA